MLLGAEACKAIVVTKKGLFVEFIVGIMYHVTGVVHDI